MTARSHGTFLPRAELIAVMAGAVWVIINSPEREGMSPMERRLIIMRHAKSSWDNDALSDHARPLNSRGCRDAPRIGHRLVQLGWEPQLVLSSDSLRTQQTYDLMRATFAGEGSVQYLHALYHAGKSELASELAGVPDDVTVVLALGHNPGWEEVVEWLCGQHVRMTTANAALLEGVGATWQEAIRSSTPWKLRDVLRPKEL